MAEKKKTPIYSAEFRERGVRLFREQRRDYPSDNAAYLAIAPSRNRPHSYDNALAESTIGLFKTEVIEFMGPWKSVAQVEWETLKWVNWYNTQRLHSTIGYITPKEAEETFYEALKPTQNAA